MKRKRSVPQKPDYSGIAVPEAEGQQYYDPNGPPRKQQKEIIGDDDLGVTLPGMLVLNSKPRGGKSHLARYLVYSNRKHIAHGIAFSKSAFRPGNLEYIPNFEGDPRYMNFKHMVFSDAVLREFLNGQARYPEGERPLGLIMFDDDISDPNMWNSPSVIDAATMYRHYNIWLIISTQYINKLSTTVRECASQVALFKMDSKRSIDAAYEAYGQEFEDAEQFKRWLFQVTAQPELHNFAWKDKINDAPWEVCRAPANIPKFRLEYGLKCSGRAKKGGGQKPSGKRKRTGRKDIGGPTRKKSRATHATGTDFTEIIGTIRARTSKDIHPFEDAINPEGMYTYRLAQEAGLA